MASAHLQGLSLACSKGDMRHVPCRSPGPLQPQVGLVILSVQATKRRATASLPATQRTCSPLCELGKVPLSHEDLRKL